MHTRKVELHISQVRKAIKVCRNSFPDQAKQKIYDDLVKLFYAIEKHDFSVNNSDPNFDKILTFTRNVLYRIFHGIEHLHYEDDAELPTELTKVLDLVANEWIEESENYFIVISYNNRLDNFYIDAIPEDVRLNYYLTCLALFNEPYHQSLIQISKPKFLTDDFLGSIPVYHELGHFIDFNYQITETIYKDPNYRSDLKQGTSGRMQLRSHLREHFADIFSAQYIETASIEALNYIAYKNAKSSTHPATDERIAVVKTFLEGTGNPEHIAIVNKLKEQTEKRTKGRKLSDRNGELTKSPFESNNPIKLDSINEVHGLFALGWHYLLTGDYIMEDKGNAALRCQRINRLIKESISMSF